jgi:hypothetical protein
MRAVSSSKAEIRALGVKPGEGKKPPPAAVKYRSLRDPTKTWAGRGAEPTWLKAEMADTGNAFAHQMLTSDFENDKVAALCAKLKIWEKCKITMRSADNGKVGHIVVQIGQPVKKEEEDNVLDMLPHENVDTPRARYTAACQFYIAAFSLVIHDAKPILKPVF